MSLNSEADRVRIGGVLFDALTEEDVIAHVRQEWASGRGGWIVTPNVDILRAMNRDESLVDLVSGALVVADGMPLLWAARLAGDVLPQRVTGASLIFSLTEAAARDGRSVYIVGGAPGVPECAAQSLCTRFPALRVAGTQSPPFGFDGSEEGVQRTVDSVVQAAPDLVFIGFGFPRQEQLIVRLRQVIPHAWFVGCGGAIPMAAGEVTRAAPWLQRLGLEWLHRLVLEPRRLAHRYLRDDLPFAVCLMVSALRARMARRHRLPHRR